MEDRWTPSPAFPKSKTGFFGKGLNVLKPRYAQFPKNLDRFGVEVCICVRINMLKGFSLGPCRVIRPLARILSSLV